MRRYYILLFVLMNLEFCFSNTITNQRSQDDSSKAINLGLELFGRSMVGGINASFVLNNRHSFDIGFSDGESLICDVKNMVYFGYSYLLGPSENKLEVGSGVGFGQMYFDEAGWLEEAEWVHYADMHLTFNLGYRYQPITSWINFKAGGQYTFVIGRKFKQFPFIYLGLGFSFVL